MALTVVTHTSHSDPNIKGDIEINMLLIVQRVSQLQIFAANEINVGRK